MKTKQKKMSPAKADAEYALNHAVVRGAPETEIEELRKISDACDKTSSLSDWCDIIRTQGDHK